MRHASPDEAAAAIAGFTVANDISMRDWQNRTLQWLQGKTFEHATPIGPWMVTPDEVGGAAPDLELTCEVDGVHAPAEPHVASSSSAPVDVVAYLSDVITLRPGDLILTGTPGGVGHAHGPAGLPARRGRSVRTAIEGIGELVNRVRAGVSTPSAIAAPSTDTTRSFSTTVPIVMRTPTPAKTRSTTPRRSENSPSAAASSGVSSQRKFASDGTTGNDSSCSAARRRARSVITPSTRSRISSCAPSDASAATWASPLTRNGIATFRERGDHVGMRDRVTHPQRGEPVRLRERAQHRDVLVTREHVEPVGNFGGHDELAVRLVEHDQAVGRHALEELRQRDAVDRGTGRVVRVAHEHEPGALGHRVGHRVEVVALLEQRNPHRLRTDLLREDRVHLERRPREHHLVAGVGGGGEGERQQVHRAGADQDLRRLHAVVRGERSR